MDETKADDLAVLMPDREVEISGETVTVRELRFRDCVKHSRELHAVCSALFDAVQLDGAQAVSIDTLDQVFSTSAEPLLTLAMVSVGKPRAWIDALSSRDGDVLLNVFWTVNSFFFMNRLVTRLALRRQPVVAAVAPSDGENSSPP